MKRFLEYDKITGRIISEITALDASQYVTATVGVLEIPLTLNLDTNACIVKDGQIVRAYETDEERRERERLAREARERSKKRIRELSWEFVIALLENDPDRIAELRAEYAHLRAYL